jgi:2-succinyl-5-enolpyruvyl-6-hydroxy-3-cyclohexene-1-carboxylate synthase
MLGDLTFLHDANGLVRGPYEARPDLTIVIVNDDGGGIFSTLEQGAPAYAESFERIFGTPHGVDIAALAAATRTPYTLATNGEELQAALSRARGLRLVEVPIDRSRTRELHDRLRKAVFASLGG